MEEALLRWNQALEIRPDDPNVKRQQQLASLYLAGMGYWQADWEQAIDSFVALYQIQPDYKDVAQRLYDARVSYGDQLSEAEEWCGAQTQYEGALLIHEDTDLTVKRDEAASDEQQPGHDDDHQRGYQLAKRSGIFGQDDFVGRHVGDPQQAVSLRLYLAADNGCRQGC